MILVDDLKKRAKFSPLQWSQTPHSLSKKICNNLSISVKNCTETTRNCMGNGDFERSRREMILLAQKKMKKYILYTMKIVRSFLSKRTFFCSSVLHMYFILCIKMKQKMYNIYHRFLGTTPPSNYNPTYHNRKVCLNNTHKHGFKFLSQITHLP